MPIMKFEGAGLAQAHFHECPFARPSLFILKIYFETLQSGPGVTNLVSTMELASSLIDFSLCTPTKANIAFLVPSKIANDILFEKTGIISLCKPAFPGAIIVCFRSKESVGLSKL